MRKTILLFACAMLCGFGIEAQESPTKAAQTAALSFLSKCDAGNFAGAYADSSAIVVKMLPVDKFSQSLSAVRTPLGKVVSRKLASATEATTLPGAPPGHYVVMTFNTKFATRNAVETVTPSLEKGAWKVSGYYIR